MEMTFIGLRATAAHGGPQGALGPHAVQVTKAGLQDLDCAALSQAEGFHAPELSAVKKVGSNNTIKPGGHPTKKHLVNAAPPLLVFLTLPKGRWYAPPGSSLKYLQGHNRASDLSQSLFVLALSLPA